MNSPTTKANSAPSAPDDCKVYTPRPLADAIIQRFSIGGQDWLEPSVGTGVFLESAQEMGIDLSRFTGVDLEEPAPAFEGTPARLCRADFLDWYQNSPSFDRIVGNPPYVSLSRLVGDQRKRAMAVPLLDTGSRVPLGANLWAAFVCACMTRLKRGGYLGLVLPASWDYADYARPLRARLPAMFDRFEVHRCLRPLFSGVLEGSVVILGFGLRGPGDGPDIGQTHRFEHEGLDDVIRAVRGSDAHVDDLRLLDPHSLGPVELCPGRECSLGPVSSRTEQSVACFESVRQSTLVRLDEVLSIRLGGVTGDVDYFLMTERERRERGLPEAAVRPVVTRASHLTTATIRRQEWLDLKASDERIWLFRPGAQLIQSANVNRYLKLEENDGGCRKSRFKIRNREPWYTTPLPLPAHGFMSGMSRFGPWLCLSRMTGLNATNTLYVIGFASHLSAKDHARWALMLLTSNVRHQWRANARSYAAGLRKMEPGDLKRLMVPTPTRFHNAEAVYAQAVDHLLSGNQEEAQRIADARRAEN